KDIGVRVPATEQVEPHTEVPPEQLVVKVTLEGQLLVNADKVADKDYVERLRGELAKRGPKDKVVFVLADDKSSYLRVVNALDGAKQAGAETLGMATELPPASR